MSASLTDIIAKAKPAAYEEAALNCSWDEFKKVIQTRRSVRIYDGSPVPETVMRNAIDAGLIAPTSSNLQQTEFYWVRSAEKKAQLIHHCFGQPAAKTASELVVVVARMDTWSRNGKEIARQLRAINGPAGALAYYEKLVPVAYRNGPLGIAGLIKRIYFFARGIFAPTPREPKSWADMRVWAHKSAALAAENFMLAMSAQGYDTCPMEGLDSKRVKKLLGLGCGAEICMGIAVGKRGQGGIYGPRMRLPREWFAFEV